MLKGGENMAKKDMKKYVLKRGHEDNTCNHGYHHCHSGNAIYGFGFIGAVIYYLANATGFWSGVLGILKAIVWPVFLVHGALKFLGL